MDTEIARTLSSLRSRHIGASFAENAEEANCRVMDLIPPNAAVGLGDSTTVRQLGVLEALTEKGIKVWNPFRNLSAEDRQRVQHEAALCDVFLTGTNAVTEDGRLVNVDAVGNRGAGGGWGHSGS